MEVEFERSDINFRMIDFVLCLFVVFVITLYRKSIQMAQEKDMEEVQQEMHKLHLKKEVVENMKQEMQDIIKYLERSNVEKDKQITFTKKEYELEVSQLTEKISERELKIQELQDITSNLKQACRKDTENECVIVTANNLDELMRLQAEKQEAEMASSELQKACEEFCAQIIHLSNDRNELLTLVSELQSKLAMKFDEYSESKEKTKVLHEENALMKIELETLKRKESTHCSKGNSMFAEVEDGRQQLNNLIKKQEVQLVAFQKRHCQTSLQFRKLLKEKATLCEDLALAKEQVSTEKLQLQFTAYKERLKDLETAQKARAEEEAAVPKVLGNNYESVKIFDYLVKEEREKTKKLWEQYEDIMMRYIAMTDEVVALKRETAAMETIKLRAEAEIIKLKQEIEKKGEGDVKEDNLTPVVERSPLNEIQNKKKCRFAPETVEPSSRKLVAKKESKEITYLTLT